MPFLLFKCHPHLSCLPILSLNPLLLPLSLLNLTQVILQLSDGFKLLVCLLILAVDLFLKCFDGKLVVLEHIRLSLMITHQLMVLFRHLIDDELLLRYLEWLRCDLLLKLLRVEAGWMQLGLEVKRLKLELFCLLLLIRANCFLHSLDPLHEVIIIYHRLLVLHLTWHGRPQDGVSLSHVGVSDIGSLDKNSCAASRSDLSATCSQTIQSTWVSEVRKLLVAAHSWVVDFDLLLSIVVLLYDIALILVSKLVMLRWWIEHIFRSLNPQVAIDASFDSLILFR